MMKDWNHEELTKSRDSHCVSTNLFSTKILRCTINVCTLNNLDTHQLILSSNGRLALQHKAAISVYFILSCDDNM